VRSLQISLPARSKEQDIEPDELLLALPLFPLRVVRLYLVFSPASRINLFLIVKRKIDPGCCPCRLLCTSSRLEYLTPSSHTHFIPPLPNICEAVLLNVDKSMRTTPSRPALPADSCYQLLTPHSRMQPLLFWKNSQSTSRPSAAPTLPHPYPTPFITPKHYHDDPVSHSEFCRDS